MNSDREQFKKAFEAHESGEYKLAAELLAPLCDNSVPEALSLLGVMYQLGDGVECNGEKAIQLLECAVKLGQGVAAHNLGTIYSGGIPGIEANPEKAKEYYRKAKSMGAQFASNEFYD